MWITNGLRKPRRSLLYKYFDKWIKKTITSGLKKPEVNWKSRYKWIEKALISEVKKQCINCLSMALKIRKWIVVRFYEGGGRTRHTLNLNFVVWLPLFVICMLCFQSLFTEALPVCLFVRWSVCVLSVFVCWPVCVLSCYGSVTKGYICNTSMSLSFYFHAFLKIGIEIYYWIRF